MRDRRALLLLTGVLFAILFPVSGLAVKGDNSDQSRTELGEVIIPPRNGLAVQILPHPAANRAEGTSSVIVRFHNAGLESVYILKPVDGSTRCRDMPYYRFTVRDLGGQPLERMRGCNNGSALWSNTKWPQDYLVEIRPGASFKVEIWLTLEVQMQKNGLHTVSFEYVYQPTKEMYDPRLVPPPLAWRGAVKAPDVVLNLKRQ